jgi:hypothetical protein
LSGKVHGTFFFYASLQTVNLIWATFMIPDNRGLSLVKVEDNYAVEKGPDEEKAG